MPRAERRRRAEVLRPQERVAEVLGGRDAVAACELLLIRARLDLDAAACARRRCSCGSASRRCCRASSRPPTGTSAGRASDASGEAPTEAPATPIVAAADTEALRRRAPTRRARGRPRGAAGAASAR